MAAIEIPTTVGFRSRNFDIGRQQQMTPSGSGFIQTIDRTSPAWFATYRTPPLAGQIYNDAISFLDKLEGSIGTFMGYDPRRVMPFAYRNLPVGSNPWLRPGQTAVRVVAQDYAASTLNLDRLATGAIVTNGDLISFLVGNIWYLFRATETKAADAGGLVTGLHVKPRPNIVGLTTAEVRYQKAACEMKIIGKIKETDSVDSFPVLEFNAAQFVNRAS